VLSLTTPVVSPPSFHASMSSTLSALASAVVAKPLVSTMPPLRIPPPGAGLLRSAEGFKAFAPVLVYSVTLGLLLFSIILVALYLLWSLMRARRKPMILNFLHRRLSVQTDIYVRSGALCVRLVGNDADQLLEGDGQEGRKAR
jgi:ABC-type transport system involved in cytochrome c biogenesis permease subunit